MDPTAALNILQNHARQKQAELAQTPPQRRRTSNVAHARSWRASISVRPLDAPQIARMSFIDRASDGAREREKETCMGHNF